MTIVDLDDGDELRRQGDRERKRAQRRRRRADDRVVLVPRPPMPWAEDGACRPEYNPLFFPRRGESLVGARTLCQSCAVRSECLEYALATNETDGVWGGLSGRERRRLRAQRRAAGTSPV